MDEGTKKKQLQLYIEKIRNNDKVREVVTIHRSTVVMILNQNFNFPCRLTVSRMKKKQFDFDDELRGK